MTTRSKSKVLTGSFDGTVFLWDSESNQPQQELDIDAGDSKFKGIRSLAEDSLSRLWTCSAYNISLWENAENLHSKMFSAPQKPVPPSPGLSRSGSTLKESFVPDPVIEERPRRPSKMTFLSPPFKAIPKPPPKPVSMQSPKTGLSVALSETPLPSPPLPRPVFDEPLPTAEAKEAPNSVKTPRARERDRDKHSKRKSKKIEKTENINVLFDSESTVVPYKISLHKLVKIIPNFQLRNLSENQSVQLTCTRNAQGQLTVNVTTNAEKK